MKIVVDVPDEEYEMYKQVANRGMRSEAIRRILKGTPLPKGHGRLIDADALKKESVMCPTVGNAETLLLDIWNVEHAPTIIEADKEYDVKAITRGNCMACGKELTEGVFFCKECEEKGRKEGAER